VFVLDDVRAIARNGTIRSLLPISSPLSPPGESTVAGRPVANLTFALNYALAPEDARETFTAPRPGEGPAAVYALLDNLWGYHLLNLVIHLTAALVLFGVVRRTLTTERLRVRFAAGAPYLACAVALLWVVHPLQTESVTYIVQRVESLMGLFYLLTLYCAIRAGERPYRLAWLAGAIVSCALGMATKEVMVTAPIVVALWDIVFRPDHRPRWRIVGGLAATWAILALLVYHEHRGPSIALDAGTGWRYLLTQTQVVTHYLGLSFVPSPLVFLYDWPLVTSILEVWPWALLMALLLGLTIVGLIRHHPLAFPGAAFFLILAPTSSVLPIITEVAAEHRMYLPVASVIAAVVCTLYALGARLTPPTPAAKRVMGFAGAFLVVTVIAAYATATRERNRDYWTEEALWQDTVAKEPGSTRARIAYGTALASARRLPEAEAQFRAALAINEQDAIAHTRLGSVLAAQDKIEDAMGHLTRAIVLRPDDIDAHRFLAQVYVMRRQDARAVPHLEEAVRLTERQDPGMLEMLSAAQAGTGRITDAAATAREALALARAQGQAALADRLDKRIKSYERQ
jgi:Flp pilus assembly protein TadD